MRLIDTHTHLFSSKFDADRTAVVEHALEQGVEKLFLPNVDLTTLQPMLDLQKEFPQNCYPMGGLHPCDIKENYKQDLDIVYQWLNENKDNNFGIGETGLDYYWDKTFINEQKDALHIHATWAKEFDLPIILHTRDSFADNVAIMEAEQNGNLKGIFHCFTGSLEEAKQVINLGFLIGLGGVITFKNSGKELRDVVEQIDLNHIVLETDSPYLAPHPNRGKRNESSFLPLIAEKIAETKSISIEEVAQHTTDNALRLFGLSR